jgi:ribosomal protein S18 acetylase RimI-like enzyme
VAVRVRAARRGDELAVAEVHVRSWQEAYRDLMPAEFLAALDPGERAERYTFEGGDGAATTSVAVDDGAADVEDGGGEGPGGDPSLTNREVRSGSPPGPFERVLGFVTFGASRDADAPDLGEVAALYVDPGCYGAGIGRLLMAEARAALRERGFEAALLWVLDGNERAQRFYEREGWSPDGSTREENPYDIVSNVSRFRRALD